VRIAIVADIHGNLSALEAIVADLKLTSPDAVFHAGDLVANGYRPVDVLDRIRALGWEGVVGNTDEMLWRPGRLAELPPANARMQRVREVLFTVTGPATREMLDEERLARLRALPSVLRLGDLAILHAAPGDLWRAPLAKSSDEELLSTYSPLGAKFIVYAHIHAPFVRKLPGFTVANTGAASLSYDGDPRASYLLFENGGFTHRRVAYDIAAEAAALRHSGYPATDWLAGILSSGRFSDPPANL
jgi:predicted phosphodiesterase